MGWDGMGWDGMGWDVMGWDGMGWDGMGWDGMGWDGMGWDGMGWDGMGWGGRVWGGVGRGGVGLDGVAGRGVGWGGVGWGGVAACRVVWGGVGWGWVDGVGLDGDWGGLDRTAELGTKGGGATGGHGTRETYFPFASTCYGLPNTSGWSVGHSGPGGRAASRQIGARPVAVRDPPGRIPSPAVVPSCAVAR